MLMKFVLPPVTATPAHHHVGLREAVRKGRRRESKECLFMCLIKFMKTFLMGVDSQRWGRVWLCIFDAKSNSHLSIITFRFIVSLHFSSFYLSRSGWRVEESSKKRSRSSWNRYLEWKWNRCVAHFFSYYLLSIFHMNNSASVDDDNRWFNIFEKSLRAKIIIILRRLNMEHMLLKIKFLS